LAASLLTSTLQVPDACVPAAPGWDVAAGVVSWPVINGDGEVF